MEFYYHEHDRDVLVLAADGGLNADTAESFVKQLETLADAGVNKIIVDCSSLQYISSYGIGVLVRLHQNLARHGGDVKVAGAKSLVLQTLNVMRMRRAVRDLPGCGSRRLAFRPMRSSANRERCGTKPDPKMIWRRSDAQPRPRSHLGPPHLNEAESTASPTGIGCNFSQFR